MRPRAARGVTYLIIALLAAQIALGNAAQSADQRGAIEEVASQPFGRVLNSSSSETTGYLTCLRLARRIRTAVGRWDGRPGA